MEIQENRVLPLRSQRDSFAYSDDVRVLEQYYRELWCAYVFVAPEIFKDRRKCRIIVDALCKQLNMPRELAYKKVRGHDLRTTPEAAAQGAFAAAASFLSQLPFSDMPPLISHDLMHQASNDHAFINDIANGIDVNGRQQVHLEIATLRDAAQQLTDDGDQTKIKEHCVKLLSNGKPTCDIGSHISFLAFQAELVHQVTGKALPVAEITASAPAIVAAGRLDGELDDAVRTPDGVRPPLEGDEAEKWFRFVGKSLHSNTKAQLRESIPDIASITSDMPATQFERFSSRIRELLLRESKITNNFVRKDQILTRVKEIVDQLRVDPNIEWPDEGDQEQ